MHIESASPASDERDDIIKTTVKEVVSQLPSGTCTIDLGAGDSFKFAPYVHGFLGQGKTCTYVPLGFSAAPSRPGGRFRE